jgi:hypothetical protein
LVLVLELAAGNRGCGAVVCVLRLQQCVHEWSRGSGGGHGVV